MKLLSLFLLASSLWAYPRWTPERALRELLGPLMPQYVVVPFTHGSAGGVTFVTSNQATGTSTQISLTITGINTNDLIACFGNNLYTEVSAPTCTDSNSDTFTTVDSLIQGGFGEATSAYAFSSGSGTVTVNLNYSTSSNLALFVEVLRGVSLSTPIDGTSGGAHAANAQFHPSTGANVVTSGNITPLQNGDIVVSATWDSNASSTSFAAGTGYTSRQTSTVEGTLEDLTQGTAATLAGTFTASTANSYALTFVIAFRH